MIYNLLAVFLLSMTPIGELRAGIPYGLLHGLNPFLTFLTAVLGNMIPVFVLLCGLPKFEKIVDGKHFKSCKDLKCFRPISCFYRWYRNRTERKYSKRFQRLGAIALITFVAVPLPITGAWTGSLAAYIFGIPPKKALTMIGLGVIIAGIIVSLISLNIF